MENNYYTLHDIKDLFNILDKYNGNDLDTNAAYENNLDTNAAYELKVLCAICIAKKNSAIFKNLVENKSSLLIFSALFKHKYEELPLLVNHNYPTFKLVVNWRLKRGI